MEDRLAWLKRLHFRELLMDYVFKYGARVRALEKKLTETDKDLRDAKSRLELVVKKLDEVIRKVNGMDGPRLDLKKMTEDMHKK